jgi:hypothetical protein
LNTIPENVYLRTGEYKPYFRTEFIDRRFDYDLIFITPTKYGNTIDDWNCARLVGYTYNGIEMAYTDENKIIVSASGTPDNTEYKFDKNTGVITLTNSKKRFYDSKIVIGNNSYQIEDLYYSKESTPTSPSGDVIKVVNHESSEFTNDVYKNFGLENGKIVGYPTKRLIDLNIKEYSDSYKYSVTNCSYDIPNVTVNTAAKAGETTSCYLSVLSNILESQFVKCEDKHFNSRNAPINPMTFEANFNSEFSAEALAAEDEEKRYKYYIVRDDTGYTEYKKIKTESINNLKTRLDGFSDFPTDEKHSISADVTGISNKPCLGILIKKITEGDNNNLTKKITLVDASTFFKIKNFNVTINKVTDASGYENTPTNKAYTYVNPASISNVNGYVIDNDGNRLEFHFQNGTTNATRGTAYVTSDVYEIKFGIKVNSVQCTLYRSESSAIGTYEANYSREEDAYYVSSNIESQGNIVKMIIYVEVDGLVYYFNVN